VDKYAQKHSLGTKGSESSASTHLATDASFDMKEGSILFLARADVLQSVSHAEVQCKQQTNFCVIPDWE